MSNQSPSAITTLPEAQRSRIGTLLGEHGLATLAGLTELPGHATPDIARRMMSCSQVFSARRAESQSEADQADIAVAYLGRAAPIDWVAGRVATLLSHYFVASQDERVAAAVAEDWCETLHGYPAWAIANACLWWMSRENPRKHCKPLPGDIQERAHIEEAPLRAARTILRLGILEPTPKREVVQIEDAAKRRAFAEKVLGKYRGDRA